jgi:ABC-type transport system involved in multi-copper enzyme maturation permease subunit
MSAFALVPLALRALRRRFLLLLAFVAVFLLAALSARALGGSGGHVELDRIFELGGPTLGAAYLVVGWLVGRFPLLVTLVLLAGVFSQDRHTGTARILLARPVSPSAVYGLRFIALAAIAFLLAALLLPLFDIVLLGHWAGPATFVLIAANIIAYGGVVALLSTVTRGDAWITLLLAILAITWNALRTVGMLDALPAGGRQFVTLVLPPHASILALESAFANIQPIPWNAFLDVCAYGTSTLLLAGLLLQRGER